MLDDSGPCKPPRGRPRQIGRPVLGHLSTADLLQDFAKLTGVLQRFPRHLRVEAALVELVRAQDLDLYLHAPQGLLEGTEEVLGVGVVAALQVRDAREAVAEVPLVVFGDAGGDLAQGVYRVRVEHEAHRFAFRLEGVHDRLADQDLAQVTHVDVAGGADTGHDHVRPRPKRVRDHRGPTGYRMTTGAAHALLHGRLIGDDRRLRGARSPLRSSSRPLR